MGYKNSKGVKTKTYSGTGKSHSTTFTIGSTGYYKFYITHIEAMLKIWTLHAPLVVINKPHIEKVQTCALPIYYENKEKNMDDHKMDFSCYNFDFFTGSCMECNL